MKLGEILRLSIEQLAYFFFEDAELSLFGYVMLVSIPLISFVTLLYVLINYFKEKKND